MKRIAIISLLAVFLSTNYAYATLNAKEVAQKIEQAHYQKGAEQEVEKLVFEFLSSYINSTNNSQLTPNNIVDLISFILGVVAYLINVGIYIFQVIAYLFYALMVGLFYLAYEFIYVTAYIIYNLIYVSAYVVLFFLYFFDWYIIFW